MSPPPPLAPPTPATTDHDIRNRAVQKSQKETRPFSTPNKALPPSTPPNARTWVNRREGSPKVQPTTKSHSRSSSPHPPHKKKPPKNPNPNPTPPPPPNTHTLEISHVSSHTFFFRVKEITRRQDRNPPPLPKRGRRTQTTEPNNKGRKAGF